jgi:hypothetical protein
MIYNAKYIFFKNKLIRYFIISNLLIILLFLNLRIIANSNQKNFRYVPNEAYGFGERLEYKVGYKFITAGTGYFHILPEPVMVNNRQCYDVRFQVKSLESLDWLYRVRDQYRSVIDVVGIFPWEFEQKIREGNYIRDFTAKFDQFNNLAIVGNKSYEVPEYVHDIVSAFYYVRTLDLKSFKKDSVFYLKNFFDDTTYNLGVRIKGRETIEVDAGKFKCIVIEPMVVEGGLFKSEGNIFVWLSDDERKIPVKVATRIPIGFVEAKLTRFSGLRGPLSAKIN